MVAEIVQLALQEAQFADDALADGNQRSANSTLLRALVAALTSERTARETAERALAKINVVRNSIIGLQKFNWSEHAYPLVAALDEAGVEGADYPEARANVGTLIEQIKAAESQLTEANEKLETATVRELEQWTRAKVLERELTAARTLLNGFQNIGFKPCTDPACYRPTLTMMQRAHAFLFGDSQREGALSPRTEDRER